jgi:hypothetical protein
LNKIEELVALAGHKWQVCTALFVRMSLEDVSFAL